MRDVKRLYSNCYKFMTSKKNDVELMEISKQIRLRAKDDGFTDDEISAQMRKAREDRDANNTNAEPSGEKPDAGVPPEELPTTQEGQKEVPQQLQQLPEQISRRARQSYEAPAGANPSGGKVRQSKVSILDIADGKQTI